MTINGSNLTYRWLAGILVALVIAFSAAWAKSIQGDVETVKTNHALLSERLARIETQVQAVDARTARIEIKLDRLPVRREQ